jgi:hypothetical protein
VDLRLRQPLRDHLRRRRHPRTHQMNTATTWIGCCRHHTTHGQVGAASVHDTAAGRVMLDVLAWRQPTVAEVWVDAAYKQSASTTAPVRHRHADGHRGPQQRGLNPQRKRWSVERTLRIVGAASPAGTALRNQPTTVPGDDSLGDDQQHDPATDGRRRCPGAAATSEIRT